MQPDGLIKGPKNADLALYDCSGVDGGISGTSLTSDARQIGGGSPNLSKTGSKSSK